MKPTKPRTFATPYAFFLARAGYSYNPAQGETREQGRRRCARALADAEARGTALGLTEEWSEDRDPDMSWMETDDYTARDRECAEFYGCTVRDASGEVRASLWGIHEDTRDPLGARWYRRVVRAELFSEALAELEKLGEVSA